MVLQHQQKKEKRI